MRKLVAMGLVSALIVSLTACGSSEPEVVESTTVETVKEDVAEEEQETEEEAEVEEVIEESENDIIESIQNDFNETIRYLKEELESTYENVGNTYEKYVKNKHYIDEWYETSESEENDLFGRTYDASIEYYKYVADTVDHDDYDAVNDALDEFYDKIIWDALDEFYNEIIWDLLDDVYDKCDDIIDEGYDWDNYSDWSDEYDYFYDGWSDAYSAMYDGWSDAYSAMYDLWSDIWSAFILDENFDVDAILEESASDEENVEGDDVEENSVEKADRSVDDTSVNVGVDPDFKAVMDNYEAFFDDYAEFMQRYENASDVTGMLSDFSDYMSECVDILNRLDEIDEDSLSAADLEYYLEVTDRIYKKLNEAY